jgi:hypothetical protein
VLSLSSPSLDPTVVSENMMDLLEHPRFLEVMSRYTAPQATEGGGEWPSQEKVLELIVGRNIDELSDAGLARYDTPRSQSTEWHECAVIQESVCVCVCCLLTPRAMHGSTAAFISRA